GDWYGRWLELRRSEPGAVERDLYGGGDTAELARERRWQKRRGDVHDRYCLADGDPEPAENAVQRHDALVHRECERHRHRHGQNLRRQLGRRHGALDCDGDRYGRCLELWRSESGAVERDLYRDGDAHE